MLIHNVQRHLVQWEHWILCVSQVTLHLKCYRGKTFPSHDGFPYFRLSSRSFSKCWSSHYIYVSVDQMFWYELKTKVWLSVKIRTGLNSAIQRWQLTLKNYSVVNQSKRTCLFVMTYNEGSFSLVEFNHMMKIGLRVVTVCYNIAGNHATFTCPD